MDDVSQKPDSKIGARIAQLRGAMGLKQSDLSESLRLAGLNWSQGTLSKVESGQRPVRLTEAPLLARALDVQLAELLTNPDYIGALREGSDRNVTEASNQLIRAQRAHWRAITHSRAVRLFEEIRDGSRGPYTVHGVDFIGLLECVTGGVAPAPHRELAGILESLGLSELQERLATDALAQVSSWVEGDRADMPAALASASRLGFGPEYWMLEYDNAADGDEQAFDDLVGDVFTELALPALEAKLDFVEFVDVNGTWPHKIDGLTGGPDEVAPPSGILSGILSEHA